MSRPKKEVTRSEIVRVKLTKEEKEDLETAAYLSGLSMSEIIRRALEKTHSYRKPDLLDFDLTNNKED